MISLKEKIYPRISDQKSVRKYEDLMPQLNRVKKLHYEIHLMNGEYTLCGDAYDIHAVDSDIDEIKPTKNRVVTCVSCIAIIKLTKNVRIKKDID